MKIELWGTYPPPIGGVTIHILRLIHSLHKLDPKIILKDFGGVASEYSYIVPVKNKCWEFCRLLFLPTKIIHLHSNNVNAFLLLLLLGWNHRIGLTIHNKNLVKVKSAWKRIVIKWFLQRASFIILNDDGYRRQLIECFHCKEERMHILPAFLPPVEIEYQGLGGDIIGFRNQHDFLVSANAYKLRLEDDVDVYGLDLLIRLVADLKMAGIDVGLIFCLPMIGDSAYYEKCIATIEKQHLQDNILIVQKPLPNGFEVWQLSDLFIRPTSTDIEGISVKEALYCGTPAIASDVCKRPPEAILFKNRNYEDLEEKVLDFYYHRELYSTSNFNCDGGVESQLMDIYRTLNK